MSSGYDCAIFVLGNISQSSFVKCFYFSLFYIFFYTQLVFVFHLLERFLYHSRPYCLIFFGLLWKVFNIFHKIFFLCYLVIFSWWIFTHFYKCEKKIAKNLKNEKINLSVDLKKLICTIYKVLVFLQLT